MQDYIALSYLSLKGQKPQRVNGNVRISFKNHVEVHIIRKNQKDIFFSTESISTRSYTLWWDFI